MDGVRGVQKAGNCGLQRGHGKELFFATGNAAPLFFLNDGVEVKEIGVGFADAFRLACQDTRKPQQAACNRQHAD